MQEKSSLEQLKEALNKNKAIIGSGRTIKYLKAKELKIIIISENCPDNLRKDIEHYSKLSGTKLEKFNGTSIQLGVFCGKPFPIATVAVMK
jgi:large subunit ribosomal protein L30e